MSGFRFLFIAVENGLQVFAEFWDSEAVFLQPQLKILKAGSARSLKVLEVRSCIPRVGESMRNLVELPHPFH